MKDITIRNAHKQDGGAVRRLVWGNRLNPFGLDWRRFLVAENELGEVIGCVQVKPHTEGSRELASLVVAAEYRSLGIGGALVRALQAGWSGPLYLMCRDVLESYYARFGFKPVSGEQLPDYFQRIERLASLLPLGQDARNDLRIMRWDPGRS